MAPENNFPKRIYLPPSGRVDRCVIIIEEVFFSTILIVMIVIGLAPIIMRYCGSMSFLGLSFSWTETLSQQMVLWITLLGAGTAVRERTSISIDVVQNVLKPRKQVLIRGMTELISALISGILIWVSFDYVSSMVEIDSDTIAFLNIPEWYLAAAMPCGFFLLTLRLLIAAIEDIIMAYKMKNDIPNEAEDPIATDNN